MLLITVIKIIIIIRLLNVSKAQTDMTRVSEASGTNVVSATVALIQQSGIFPYDNRIIRRLAYVESRDGEDPETFRSGYNGGIWQVDERVFQKTLNLVQYEQLVEIYEHVNKFFSIWWHSVEWVQLRIPLYSALAARMFIFLADDDIPDAGDVMKQAFFWKNSTYNSNDMDTVLTFIDLVNDLELTRELSLGSYYRIVQLSLFQIS